MWGLLWAIESKMKFRHSISQLILSGCLLCLAIPAKAQHYPAGSEGIKGASLPPPGFYFEDYNSFYYSDRTPGFGGQLEHYDQFNYVQAPRLIWMTGWKFIGADYGMAIKAPLIYKEFKRVSHFGLSDVQIEPLILSWHLKRFDFVTGYSFWAPTGNYDKNELFLFNLGDGYWTHTFTLGVTWYPDKKKAWAISLLNHYEINTEQYRSLVNVPPSPSAPLGIASFGTTLGDIYTLEWAVSKTFVKGMDIGLTGYYQQQVTGTQGPTFNGPTWQNERVHVAGIGPEVKADFPKWGLSTSLRYAYEFTAMDHPQGNLITLTVTKSF
jgi:hypothetical protein